MSDRLANVLCCAIGAAVGCLLADVHSRRKAERRTLTVADQKWMAGNA